MLLDYIEEDTDGFRVLTRDAPVTSASGTFSSLIGEVARKVEHILGAQFAGRGYDPQLAELYSQALVGMVALVGQWWLDARRPGKREVAAHLVNLAWNGLAGLERQARSVTDCRRVRRWHASARRTRSTAWSPPGGANAPTSTSRPLEVLCRVTRLARHVDRARGTAFAAHDLEGWEFDVLAALRRAGEPVHALPGRPRRADAGHRGP